MNGSSNALGVLVLGGVLAAAAWTLAHAPPPPQLDVTLPAPVPCQPQTRFTSFAPPALPGEWHGDHGFFAIPGTLELQLCRPGTLTFQARGDLADNGGPPLLVVRTDQGQTEHLVSGPQRVQVQVGASGRALLAFPNDETNAAYRILTLERLAVVGERRCVSVLVRGSTRQTFEQAATGAVYDVQGQRLEPCQPGRLYLTVSGVRVEGEGPRLRVTQNGQVLLDQNVTGRQSLSLPLVSKAPVQLSVTNFLGRPVKYRNLFIDDLKFQASRGRSQ